MHARVPALRLLRIARTINLEAAVGLEIAHVDCDAFCASVEKRDNAGLWTSRVGRYLAQAEVGKISSLRRRAWRANAP
jgi:hypothetical protein